MERYVAVDSGKYATKIAVYDAENDSVSLKKCRTKISDGNFMDDALEKSTVIAEISGKVYKVGNGALQEAELDTNKATEIHKVCILTAIAMSVEDGDEVHVALGMPIKEWENVDKRVEYKKYLLPEGNISVKIMHDSEKGIMEKNFKVISKHVYPESQGALFLRKVAPLSNGTVAVVDLGNLNINCTCWNNRELDRQYSLTDELGGNILINGLSQELSSAFSRCDVNYVAKVLKQPPEMRKLIPNRPNKEIEEKSKELISNYLVDHVKQIKRCCDAKHWSLDFMDLVFIGGTSELLKDEIRVVFGDNCYIPNKPEYANVAGFLRVMCSKLLNKVIELPDLEEKTGVQSPS